MVLGVRPGAATEVIALTSEASVRIPHELPGQDPEGGSEVNFGDGDSSAAATPRDASSGGAGGAFNDRVSTEGVPRSPPAQVGVLGGLCSPTCATAGCWTKESQVSALSPQ